MANASFFEVVYALAIVARASLLIAKSSGSVGWSCPETARFVRHCDSTCVRDPHTAPARYT